MANCCPSGYWYNPLQGGCCPDPLCPGGCYCPAADLVPTIPCPPDRCCPTGYAYVNLSGVYSDPILGTFSITNYAGGVPSDTYGMCVQTQTTNAYGPLLDPNDCPCCDVGYAWSSVFGQCVNLADLKMRRDPIPCIVCVCPPPDPPPPPCVGCAQSQGVPIVYAGMGKSVEGKTCTDCHVVGEPTGLGTGADAFIPVKLLDPIINFILRL